MTALPTSAATRARASSRRPRRALQIVVGTNDIHRLVDHGPALELPARRHRLLGRQRCTSSPPTLVPDRRPPRPARPVPAARVPDRQGPLQHRSACSSTASSTLVSGSPPITCLETAERLVRNYATDPTTKNYVDNLDIFILPSSTRTAGTTRFYDFSAQRKNLTNYCAPTHERRRRPAATPGASTSTATTPSARCSTATPARARPARATPSRARSRPPSPRSRTSSGSRTRSRSIKFAINIHTHGGYFMWAPGAYKSRRAA